MRIKQLYDIYVYLIVRIRKKNRAYLVVLVFYDPPKKNYLSHYTEQGDRRILHAPSFIVIANDKNSWTR